MLGSSDMEIDVDCLELESLHFPRSPSAAAIDAAAAAAGIIGDFTTKL